MPSALGKERSKDLGLGSWGGRVKEQTFSWKCSPAEESVLALPGPGSDPHSRLPQGRSPVVLPLALSPLFTYSDISPVHPQPLPSLKDTQKLIQRELDVVSGSAQRRGLTVLSPPCHGAGPGHHSRAHFSCLESTLRSWPASGFVIILLVSHRDLGKNSPPLLHL